MREVEKNKSCLTGFKENKTKGEIKKLAKIGDVLLDEFIDELDNERRN